VKPPSLLRVGTVARAHGNRGDVIVNPETDFAEERFREGKELLVGDPVNPTERRIVRARFHQRRPVIHLQGVETMDDAEALAGSGLWIGESEAGRLPADTFYHHELIGCEVRDTNGRVLGRVRAVEGPMERSRLVVDGVRGEIQIPLAQGICVVVDPKAGRIVVDPPEGLLELNERP